MGFLSDDEIPARTKHRFAAIRAGYLASCAHPSNRRYGYVAHA